VYEKMLSEISENAGSIECIDNFIYLSLEKMGTILEVTRVFLFSYDEVSDTYKCLYGWNSPNIHPNVNSNEISLSIPWATKEFMAARVINFENIRKMPGECYRNHLIKMRIMSTLNVPLYVRGKLYGFIGFDEHRFNRKWVEEDVYILSTAAQIITRTLENKLYKDEVEQHKSHLELIFSSVQDAIVTVDTEMRIVVANKSAATLCGIEVSKGMQFLECANQCNNVCVSVLQKILHEKSTVKEFRVECVRQRQHNMVAMLNCSPLNNSNGIFLGAVLVIRDISRITSLENKLQERQRFHNMVGISRKMSDMWNLVKRLSDISATVLITGESGTGKELVAHALHHSGLRSNRPFVKVNCSALAENLLESELFGHAKGAFTGAHKDTIGRFESAGAGTILLDEIGDISPNIQLKLLRVLQEKEFERVGESKPRTAHARVLASTNKDLKKAIKDGRFREDLYYRLNVMDIHIPPLRERPEDIPALVEYFLGRYNQDYQKDIQGIDQDATNLLLRYPWPGNIRELEHAIERAVILCSSSNIAGEHLPVEILRHEVAPRADGPIRTEILNAEIVLNTLEKTAWNISKASRRLNISRWTLYRKMQQLGLHR
jgi:two-component system response regulator HydG